MNLWSPCPHNLLVSTSPIHLYRNASNIIIIPEIEIVNSGPGSPGCDRFDLSVSQTENAPFREAVFSPEEVWLAPETTVLDD